MSRLSWKVDGLVAAPTAINRLFTGGDASCW
jgi:hypothetical protein